MTGFLTLLYKELLRFWKVGFQTVLAPIVSTLLYLLIFFHVLETRVEVYQGVSYTTFLIPGLVMMAVMQNAFANASSSMIQSKISGNIVFVLLSPLTYREIFMAYILASVVRGLLVGIGVYLVTWLFFDIPLFWPVWIIMYAVMGSALLGALGVIAGIWADKFDQLAAFQNFLIMPLTFLSGVFYSIHSLPPAWQYLSHLNPFFYMIDGFRYGFFGVSDISPYVSLVIVTVCFLAVSYLAIQILRTGYKLRH
ncbi:ABC-2 type transport system permease protein [Nitrosomonas aestuarii]|uniref:Transport permease protein n=1 Tax=Nitrosomonas aestuarii TaxID=52441 RepID=A0A1I3ZRP3_9PROT|nr:ABC transporter permease [Nitrosomonas aestuarii]SFK46627.1 ABC-2 type transport system permease protein [Nitrosomonas aestuarii]